MAIKTDFLVIGSGLAGLTNADERAAVEAIKPPPAPPSAGTLNPLPPVRAFESRDAAKLRSEITETRRRIGELERLLAGLEDVNARRRQIEAQLAELKKLEAKKSR